MPERTLADYIRELVQRLEHGEPAAFNALRRAAGAARARIGLDDESVDVRFVGARLVVSPQAGGGSEHSGWTSRATCLALLDGRLELTDAILDGQIEVHAPADRAVRLIAIVEILIDAATRVPALRALADEFRDSCRVDVRAPFLLHARSTPFGPCELPESQISLLARLDLLP